MTVHYAGARQAGLTEEKIASLHDESSARFSARERIALRFAELMAVDHLKIDDALFAELRRHFTEAEVIELGIFVGLFLGLGRFNAVLGIDPV